MPPMAMPVDGNGRLFPGAIEIAIPLVYFRLRNLLLAAGHDGGPPVSRNIDPLDQKPLCHGRADSPPHFSFSNPNLASHEPYSAKNALPRQKRKKSARRQGAAMNRVFNAECSYGHLGLFGVFWRRLRTKTATECHILNSPHHKRQPNAHDRGEQRYGPSSVAAFRADTKWRDYRAHCDKLVGHGRSIRCLL
jgi:hypothetical protein